MSKEEHKDTEKVDAKASKSAEKDTKKDDKKRTYKKKAVSNKKAKKPLTEEEKTFNKRVARGFAIAIISAAVGAGVTYGVQHSGANNNTVLVSMKGATVSVGDLYAATKTNSANTSVLQNIVLYNVLQAKYGDKVSSKDVNTRYQSTLESLTTYASYYGTTASGYVAQQYGVSLDAFKKYYIRESLLATYALEQAAKKEATESAMKKAYETYMPDTEVQVIQLSDSDTANAVLSSVKADGADFASIAKDKTVATDKKYSYTVNSSSTDLPSDLLTKIKGMNAGDVSDVISVTNSSTYATNYYIVKVVSRKDKDSNWQTYKTQLTNLIVNEKTNDSSFQKQVVANILKEYNVKVKDNDLSNLLANYTETSSTSSSNASSSAASSASSSSSK